MLKLTNIKKSFSDCFKPIFTNLNLTIKPGEFCILIGSNGSGKSTLLNIIAGEESIDAGKILINNIELFSQAVHSNLVASVIQDPNKGTIAEMSLLENMALCSLRSRQPALRAYHNYQQTAVAQLLELNIGLEQRINSPLASFSGGQRQMLATLMAINSAPKILLLDEHTSALDPKMQKNLMRYTANMVIKHKITTLMVTHKLDDAINYGDRLIMLHQGELVLDLNQQDKALLTVDELLALFHKYEDLTLKHETID